MEIENSSDIYSNSAGSPSFIKTAEYLPSGSLSSHQDSVEYTDGESELPNQHIFFHESSLQGIIPYEPHNVTNTIKIPASLRSLDIIQDNPVKIEIEENSSEYSKSLSKKIRLDKNPSEIRSQSKKTENIRFTYDSNKTREYLQFLLDENRELKQSLTTYSLKYDELEKKLKKSRSALRSVQERLDFIENHSRLIIKSLLSSVGKTNSPIDMQSSSLYIDVLKILDNKNYTQQEKTEEKSISVKFEAPKRFELAHLSQKSGKELQIEDSFIESCSVPHKAQFIDYYLDKTLKEKRNRNNEKSNSCHEESEFKAIFTCKNVLSDLKKININSVKALKDLDISRRSLNFKFSNLLNKS